MDDSSARKRLSTPAGTPSAKYRARRYPPPRPHHCAGHRCLARSARRTRGGLGARRSAPGRPRRARRRGARARAGGFRASSRQRRRGCERILVPFVDAPAGGPGRHLSRLLDHDSAFQCAVVCRAWREVALAPDSAVARRLIADVVRANAGILAEADAPAARAPETGHPDPPEATPSRDGKVPRAQLRLLLAAREMTNGTTTTTTTSSSRQLYADVCAFACYDCREMRDALDPAPRAPRTTAGTLRVRLCVTCSRGYSRWRPTGQRLVTATLS